MKFSKAVSRNLRFLISNALVLSLSSFALAEGGTSSGGGNGFRGTPEAVAREVEHMDVAILLGDVKKALTSTVILPIQDVRAKSILTQILALKNVVRCQDYSPNWACQTVLSTAPISPMHVQMKGACIENGQERDASVTYHLDKTNEPVLDNICMSAERLAIYPDALVLARQLQALIVHELSHVAGYGEEDAVYIQNYVINTLYKPCLIHLSVSNSADSTFADDFQIKISRGNMAEVTHKRELGTVQSNILLTDYNWLDGPGAFALKWSSAGGSMEFHTLNNDGTSTPNHLVWGPMSQPGWAAGDFISETILSSDTSFEGVPLKIGMISISPDGCQR